MSSGEWGRPARRGRGPQGLLPDQERDRARPPRRRHPAVDDVTLRRSAAARRSGSSASPAAASRRSAARSSGSTSRPRAGSCSTGRTSRSSSENELRPLRRRMQMVFQDPFASLNPRHSVGRIVGEPLRAHGLASRREVGGAGCASCSRSSVCRPTPPTRYPHEFSRRPAPAHRPRARARAQPGLRRRRRAGVGARRLDPGADHQPARGRCRSEFELTYLFIAHDLAVVRHISDRIAVMYLGWIVEVSPADELYEQPAAPVHDLAALGRADPRPGGRAAARADPARRRPAEPGEPAARRAASTRAARTCSRRAAATRCPPLRELSQPGTQVACHWAEEIKEGRIKPREREPVFEPPPAQSRWKSRRQPEDLLALERRDSQLGRRAAEERADEEQFVERLPGLDGCAVARRPRRGPRRPRVARPRRAGSVRTAATLPPATKTARDEARFSGRREQAAARTQQLVVAA